MPHIRRIFVYLLLVSVIIGVLMMLQLSFGHLLEEDSPQSPSTNIQIPPTTTLAIPTNYPVLNFTSNNHLVLHRLRDRIQALNGNSSSQAITMATPTQSFNFTTKFPHVFIIGFAKTGTKALYEALKLHPQLSGPRKEMRYFTAHFNDYNLQDYINKFPHCPKDGFNVEKSPDYILSLKAADRLKTASINVNINPTSLKFVIIVRNPVVRTVSDFMELQIWSAKHSKNYANNFNQYIMLNQAESKLASCSIVNSSCYSYHIQQWMTVFNKSQLCFVNGDMFIRDPYKEVKLLESCLGLSSYFQQSNFVFKPQIGFYCFSNEYHKGGLCMGPSKGRHHPFVKKSIVSKLKSYFSPWNKELYNIINRTDFDWETSKEF